MSPAKTSKDGTYRFDRVFRSVGRVTLSSGTRKLAEFRRRDALLTKLYDQSRLDILRALLERRLTIQDVVLADRQERLSAMASDLLARRPLWPAVNAVLDRMKPGATVTRYRGSWKAFAERGPLGPRATIAELARVDWVALEQRWGKSAADWNHLRRSVSRFLSVALDDKYHPIRRAVMQHFPERTEVGREPDLDQAAFLATIAHVSPHLRPAYWAILILGLRIGEFCALQRDHLRGRSHSVLVPGRKTKDSGRILPVDPRNWRLVDAAVPCPVTHWHIRNVWRKARKAAGIGDIRIHDLRHTMAQWSTDAGADLPMIQAQLGHATVLMTGKYAKRTLRQRHAQIMGDILHGVPQPVPRRRAK